MNYEKTVLLKDGQKCLLKSAAGADGEAVYDLFNLTHGQTEYLLSYPDENRFTVSQERDYLAEKAENPRAVEICAWVDGCLTGTAGIEPVGDKDKVRHRAEFGINVDQAHWRRGIGRALTEACIQCARQAGYAQLELDVVSANGGAVALYRSLGFEEYGRNPKGFRTRGGQWQELVLMRLELTP